MILLFLIPLLLLISFFVISKKKAFSKKLKKFFIYTHIGIALCTAVLFFLLIGLTAPTKQSEEKADGFTIESYNIKMNVGENNIVDVTETITVDFYESGHHGIYRTIPEWLKYTSKDGKTNSRKSVITELKSPDDNYQVTKGSKKQTIKIGDENKKLDKGLKTYTISYKYDMGKDPYEGFDEFIFHSIGDYWGTKINNVSLEITMPKKIEKDSIKFFADKKRTEDITSKMNYYITGNTIYAKLSSDYELTNALTIDIELPDNYFVGANDHYNNTPAYATIIIFINFIIILIILLISRKKPKALLNEKDYYVPENLEPAEVACYKKQREPMMATAIIINLAMKQIIKIEQKEDNRIIITNLYSSNRKEAVTKMNNQETILYNHLFRNGEVNEIKNDKAFNNCYSLIKKSIEESIDSKVGNQKSYIPVLISTILLSFNLVFFIIQLVNISKSSPNYYLMYYISFVLTGISIVMSNCISKKNKTTEIINKKIDNYKESIKNLNSDDISKIIKNDPDYFSKTIAYAYVLGISKILIDKFKDVKLNYNIGSIDIFKPETIDSINSAIYYPLNDYYTTKNSSGGGCSSCGGGCSSCGGGGSW